MATELDDSQRRDAFRRKIETKVAAGLRGGVEADVSLIAMVGPPEAEVLLSFSRGNRNESEATVEAYARDMVAGNWTVENGNPIVLTASGRLANGHHRLRAVVAAKTVIRLKISFGNPEEALDVADGHRPRSLADRFALRGERNTHRTLAALRMCMVLCDNKRSLTAKRTMTEIEAAFVDHAPALAALRGHFHHKFPASFWGALLFAHPNAFMRDAFRVLDAWGFRERTILTWVKDRMGTGDWLRGKTEHCILAVRGRPAVTLTNQTTVLSAPLREHSRKPEAFFVLVDGLCPGSKLEMFAREPRAGWSAWGAESSKFEVAS